MQRLRRRVIAARQTFEQPIYAGLVSGSGAEEQLCLVRKQMEHELRHHPPVIARQAKQPGGCFDRRRFRQFPEQPEL